MLIKYDSSAFRRTRWNEYVSRFIYGGLMTVGTGLIGKRFGPSLAGLFLAFPAIFPASVSLIDKHQRKAKGQHGLVGVQRGRQAAAVETAGSSAGAAGLIVFAILSQKFIGAVPFYALVLASFGWRITVIMVWWALLSTSGSASGSWARECERWFRLFDEIGALDPRAIRPARDGAKS
jgi:hypothetical protein